jgi:hypothetical protein
VCSLGIRFIFSLCGGWFRHIFTEHIFLTKLSLRFLWTIQSEQQSGFDHFFQSAQSVLAEAISSGAAEKLLSGILSPNQNQGFSPQNAQYGQYPHPQQQFQQRGPPQGQGQRDFNVPQYGGEGSVGGLGSVGSFLSNLASQVLHPQQQQQQPQGGQGQYGPRNQF